MMTSTHILRDDGGNHDYARKDFYEGGDDDGDEGPHCNRYAWIEIVNNLCPDSFPN